MAASLEEVERRRLALIGDVAHELRTPLSTIEGYAEGLLDGVVEATPATFALLHREAGRLRLAGRRPPGALAGRGAPAPRSTRSLCRPPGSSSR